MRTNANGPAWAWVAMGWEAAAVVITLPTLTAVLLDAGTWAAWSVLVGLVGARWPDHRLARDGAVTRIRRVEEDGNLYRRLGIRRWKRWLPDLGRFGGGRSKHPGATRRADTWRLLEIDARRAELVHWATLLALPVTLLWSPGILAVGMVVYGGVANLPCIAAQRHTRLRLAALQVRMAASQ